MILPNLREEKRLWKRGFRVLVGVDEVGRGALAGPLVAAAVWWKKPRASFAPPIPVKDSKKLSPRQRRILYEWLRKHPDWAFRTACVSPRLIDRINVRQTNLRAMARAVRKLPTKPYALLIDGVDKLPLDIRQYTYIKGDEKHVLISLASIVAKVTRDERMKREAQCFPRYKFEKHKGYGTLMHRRAIKRHGPSLIHRKSFLSKMSIKELTNKRSSITIIP